LNLDLTLKAAAILLLLISGMEYLVSSVIHLGPVLFANVMFVTSIFSRVPGLRQGRLRPVGRPAQPGDFLLRCLRRRANADGAFGQEHRERARFVGARPV
jgi:hypothetical protein